VKFTLCNSDVASLAVHSTSLSQTVFLLVIVMASIRFFKWLLCLHSMVFGVCFVVLVTWEIFG
jgi:hypothetical protein